MKITTILSSFAWLFLSLVTLCNFYFLFFTDYLENSLELDVFGSVLWFVGWLHEFSLFLFFALLFFKQQTKKEVKGMEILFVMLAGLSIASALETAYYAFNASWTYMWRHLVDLSLYILFSAFFLVLFFRNKVENSIKHTVFLLLTLSLVLNTSLRLFTLFDFDLWPYTSYAFRVDILLNPEDYYFGYSGAVNEIRLFLLHFWFAIVSLITAAFTYNLWRESRCHITKSAS